MELATWILIIILSVTLTIFLIVGIILIIKLIGLVNDARVVVAKGQDLADRANGIAENVKDMTSIGGVVKTFASRYNSGNGKNKTKSKK